MEFNFIYVVSIVIGLGFMYFVVLMGKSQLALEIIKIVIVLGGFLSIFIVKFLYLNRRRIAKINSGEIADTQLVYVTAKPKQWDRLFSLALGVLVLYIAFSGGEINLVDYFQVIIAFCLYYFWHQFLFSSRISASYTTVSVINGKDKMQNEGIIILLPILILLLPILGRQFNTIDIWQAIIVFILSYSWQIFLFSRKEQ